MNARVRPAHALLLAALVWVPQYAVADTIYLTNGRVIHTASVRIEGDLVIFQQFGGEVSIPRSAVARIVEDEEVEQRTVRAEVPSEEAATTEGEVPTGEVVGETAAADAGAVPADAADATDDSATDAPAGDAGDPDDPSDAAYWAQQIRAVDERIARANQELDELPFYDTADRNLLRFSAQARYFIAERDRWEGLLRDFEATRRQLMEGARRAGITPGALRDALARAGAGGGAG